MSRFAELFTFGLCTLTTLGTIIYGELYHRQRDQLRSLRKLASQPDWERQALRIALTDLREETDRLEAELMQLRGYSRQLDQLEETHG